MHGYVRCPDGSYDYFRLGVIWPTDEGMRGQWEYYRRYMEEGPDALPEPEILLPIERKRESFRMGAQLCEPVRIFVGEAVEQIVSHAPA
ncbi:hypothetical protein BGV69_30770 [Burkholderia ubonensis]|nr:hypothetical protein BGV69_30770 [Burkholderia ubonensis]